MSDNDTVSRHSGNSFTKRLLPSLRKDDLTQTNTEGQTSDGPRSRRRSSISTRYILQRFQKYVPDNDLATKCSIWEVSRSNAQTALKTLSSAAQPQTIAEALWQRVHKPSFKSPDKLLEAWRTAIEFYAKPRSRVTVYITDFRRNDARHMTDELGNVDNYFENKPADVQFRWIHVPIGQGPLQSTLEDMFNYAGSQTMGRPFRSTGNEGWPYPEIPMLSFWSKDYLDDQTNAFNKLQKLDCRGKPHGEPFSVDPLEGLSELEEHDLKWRVKQLGKTVNHWEIVESDFPSILEQTFLAQTGALDTRTTMVSKGGSQALTRHKQFNGAMLMTNRLRAFHRDDGYIITFSNPSGVDHIGDHFRECLARDPEDVFRDPEASVFGHTFEAFLDSGTSAWGRRTAEWFIIYLFTEAAVTPHNIRHGCNAVSFLQGFAAISKELEQQERPQARGSRSKLVSKYVECVHDLKALQTLTQSKMMVIERLKQDCERFETEYDSEGVERNTLPDAETAMDRLEWARSLLVEQEAGLDRMLTHFQDSMNLLFQQQSIELNEMAIAADSQNSAILIFTAVTIIFLPLSFLTSYFGMNLQGVVETHHDQSYFWKICSGFTTALLGVVFISAYKKNIAFRMRQVGGDIKENLFEFRGLADVGDVPVRKGDLEKGNGVWK